MSCKYEQYYLTGWLPEQLGIPQYAEHPYQNCGHSNFKDKEEEAKFQKAVTFYAGQGMMSVHTQGSQAAENTLEVYCNAQKAIGESFGKEEQKVRYRLEHAVFLSDDEISTAKGLDVHLSFHVLHLYWYGADFKELLNSRALKSVMPIKEALKMGHRFSFHTDSPQYPPDPLLTVRTAVTRRTFKNEDDQPYDKNGISVDDALKAITIDAAHSLNLDHLIGSLKVGKKADLVVLMNNPKTVAPECIHKICVHQLFVDGKQVWINGK